MAEVCLASSVADATGSLIQLKQGYMGRADGKPIASKMPANPKIRKARDDHHNPEFDQGSIELRRYLKQLHRLQSLRSQLKPKELSQRAMLQTQMLWDKIIDAKGFKILIENLDFSTLPTIHTTGMP